MHHTVLNRNQLILVGHFVYETNHKRRVVAVSSFLYFITGRKTCACSSVLKFRSNNLLMNRSISRHIAIVMMLCVRGVQCTRRPQQ